jgi:RNase P subunit RPR2
MSGRYGMDQLNTFLMVLYLLLYLVFIFVRWFPLELLALVLLIITLLRMLSRKHDRRRAENAKFLQLTRPMNRKAKNLRVRLKDREHRYFKCPGCGQQMRVPRGKGRITVHCRSCGATFEEKS